MKKLLKSSFIFFFMLLLVTGIYLAYNPISFAEENAVEESFAKLYINDLAGYTQDSATRDSKTGNITNVAAFGRVGYNDKYQNVEITSIINFSTIGNTTFALRAQGDSLLPAGNAGWTNSGYYIRWYPHGQFDFVKNDTVIGGAFWGTLPGSATTDTDYTVVFKTVNLSDGSVQVTFSINGYVIVDYNDADSPITEGGWFLISSEGSSFSASGYGFDMPVVELSNLSDPILSANFPANIDENGVVNTSGANSGAGYAFQNSTSYTYKTQIKATTDGGDLSGFSFTIGASKTNSNEINRPNVVDANWGWSETGYVFRWLKNGQRHIDRNGKESIVYVWDMPTFNVGETYEIEYGITDFDDGSVRLHFRINGDLAMIYYDRPTEDYTPLQFSSLGGQPSNIVNYAMVLSFGMDAQIIPYEQPATNQYTIASKDLGEPLTINSVSIDRNGSISSLVTGSIVGFSNVEENSSITMKANFSNTAGNLAFTLAGQGNLDTPWGGGWTRRGYQIYYYANGQTILAKNDTTICEGWALSGYSIAPNTEYTLEIGTIYYDGAIQVYAKINGAYILNYLDYDNALTGGGWFSVYSGGFEGKLEMTYEKPSISIESNTIDVDDTLVLDYNLSNKNDNDNVGYFIDTALSTAQGEIDGNIITAKSAGNLEIYACVNGIYSDNVSITVQEGEYAYITNLPTSPILVGGEIYTLEGALSSGEQITSKSFTIENVTGQATIDDNGTLTPISAGTVRVYVTINGIKSEGYLLTISPKIEIKNSSAMAVGETRDLGVWANCELPDEEITYFYELIDGQDIVNLDPLTGEITANDIGMFTVRVTISGETFSATSAIVTIPVEAPVVVLNGVKDMYVGQTITLYPKINEGVTITSKEIVIVSGDDILSVDGDNVTALKEGTARIKAVVNNIESKEFDIVVNTLQATIIVSNNMVINSTQDLSVMFNFDYEYQNVVYSIVEGADFASIEGNVLTSFNNVGVVTIQAVVDGKYTATATINITNPVVIAGISNNQEVLINSKINLSFLFLEEGDVESVELVVIEGKNKIDIEKLELGEDELLSDTQYILTALDTGKVKLKLVVNGIDSDIIEFNIYKNSNALYKYILIVIFVALAIAIISIVISIIIIKKRKDKKLKTNDTKENTK